MSSDIPINKVNIPRELSQNLQHHLWDRENGYNRKQRRGDVPQWHQNYEREIHKCITPNLTVQNVNKPLGFMRKFTPDGKLLISFSHNQRSLEVHSFQGVHAAADLLVNETKECITAADDSMESLDIRQRIFERLFHLKWTIRVTLDTLPCLLNREFSIFLEDGRYVLVAATLEFDIFTLPPIENLYIYSDLYDDCELVGYVFYLIDLQKGCISDILPYRRDCIMLSHNHGVSMHGRVIAILSQYRQTIDLYELVEGKLVKLMSVGDFANVLDAALFKKLPESSSFPSMINKLPLSCLKQRILTHIYRRIIDIESLQLRNAKLKTFYEEFRIYERMLISKMQLIDEDHILLRYQEREGETITTTNNDMAKFKLYVFYCISEAKILRVFKNNSIELLYLMRNFCDTFRNVRSLQTQRPSSSHSNDVHCRAAFNSAISSIPGGHTEAALRFNPILPISTQSFATTQYMDYSLFNYDDSLISALERPKISSLEPIRFSDRNTNLTKFRLFLESPTLWHDNNGATMGATSGRELVAFIFHPYEPFIISIQKISSRYVVNFHIYNKSTVVKQ